MLLRALCSTLVAACSLVSCAGADEPPIGEEFRLVGEREVSSPGRDNDWSVPQRYLVLTGSQSEADADERALSDAYIHGLGEHGFETEETDGDDVWWTVKGSRQDMWVVAGPAARFAESDTIGPTLEWFEELRGELDAPAIVVYFEPLR